ncbi:hypothetical protein EEJ88_19395 [Salmonella enterica]|uniref:Uncharacterized protein n=3 Tax=Salmonella enterica TaxID=28901 RepID=A0A5W1RG68_SALET|nr:hypothetical protein [Salmonella enterica subsp. enterica serovar Orion]EAA8083984.1 hypothetical protein [Salmonella enterica]EAA9983841.1 hypothetical protein [Salmonella enterica subsp. enterica serovar Adelaide]EAB7818031.1 hypothetical protein [Salmonella enterica subsp. enterica]EBH8623574.1 hypothetical protein [Salmonella enterica subsp. enterica serovar Tees]EBS5433833.1 hypothetical protein [Salmonella enterica subsp. enterica serovar Binza]EBW1951426.1 hypothetical protein [Salm
MPDGDAKHLIRPTGGYCFVTAGWRRETSYPAYGRVLFCDCRMATRSALSGLRRVLFCDCRMATRSVLSGLRRVLFVGRISASAIRHFL